jgi:hypothetical protein
MQFCELHIELGDLKAQIAYSDENEKPQVYRI